MRRKQFRGNHKTALERGGNIIMKKRIISLAAAAVFVIGTLAGCGNSSTQTTDKTASSDASSSSGDLVTVRDAVMTGQLISMRQKLVSGRGFLKNMALTYRRQSL